MRALIFLLFLSSIISITHKSLQSQTISTQKRAILHIGGHKTGSTYLQSAFMINRALLRENGYRVLGTSPKSGAILAFNLKKASKQHHGLFRDAGFIDEEKYLDLATQLKTGQSSIIISSEEFDDFKPSSAQLLVPLLSTYSVTVVFFHRERSSLLRSFWSQFSKERLCPLEFKTFLHRHTKANFTLIGGLEMKTVLHTFSSIFGVKSVRIISFDGVIRLKKNLLDVFVQDVLNLPIDGLRYPDHQAENKSPSSFDFQLHSEICSFMHKNYRFIWDLGNDDFATAKSLLQINCSLTTLTEIGSYFRKEDGELFREFGKPLYYYHYPPYHQMCDFQNPILHPNAKGYSNFTKFLDEVFNRSSFSKLKNLNNNSHEKSIESPRTFRKKHRTFDDYPEDDLMMTTKEKSTSLTSSSLKKHEGLSDSSSSLRRKRHNYENKRRTFEKN
jgi:hypothetical protein